MEFLNENISNICCEQGIDYDQLKAVLKIDQRLGHTHFDVPGPDGAFGFGGKCFPKDTALIKNLFAQGTAGWDLFEMILDINQQLRK